MASSIEPGVGIADRLVQAVQTAKFLFGDRYAEQVAPWAELIPRVMEAEQTNAIGAALWLQKELEQGEKLTAGVQLLILAAAIEVMDAAIAADSAEYLAEVEHQEGGAACGS